MDKQKYYSCQCGNEVLSVYFDDNEAIVEFAIYWHDPNKLNFRERIQECLRILRGQPYFHDQIIFWDEQAKELAMDLLGGVKDFIRYEAEQKSPPGENC